METPRFLENGVPVDVQIRLDTMSYLYLGGTIVGSVVVAVMLSDLIRRLARGK